MWFHFIIYVQFHLKCIRCHANFIPSVSVCAFINIELVNKSPVWELFSHNRPNIVLNKMRKKLTVTIDMAFNGRILLDITKLVTLSTTEITYYFHALKINVLCHHWIWFDISAYVVTWTYRFLWLIHQKKLSMLTIYETVLFVGPWSHRKKEHDHADKLTTLKICCPVIETLLYTRYKCGK